MKTLILIAALAAPLAITAPPAAAQDHAEVRQTVLKYADLDLAQPAGARAMLSRIRQAARTVCGGEPATRELRERANHNACIAASMRTAVERLDAPLVTALYRVPGRTTALARK